MADSLDSLKEKVRALRSDFEAALREAKDARAVQSVRDRFLGRKSGTVTGLLKSLVNFAEDARRDAGQELNRLKAEIETKLSEAQSSLDLSVRDARLRGLDVTLPGRVPARGHRHPLTVGPTITLGDAMGTIEAFLHSLSGPQYPSRFRASFFPYTEPSMEADLACVVCGGKGCRVCKNTGWLEIMGSGMVHPAVFEAVHARLGSVGYDPEKVTGCAFGLGIERVAMVRHAVDNIRL